MAAALGPGADSPFGLKGVISDALRDLKSSVDSRIEDALVQLGIADLPASSLDDGSIRALPSNPDLVEFTYLGKRHTVSSIQLTMMFTVGSLVQVGIPDPVMNQGTKFFGVSPAIEAFLRTLAVVPPGDYAYRLNAGDYATFLKDVSYTSNDANVANPQNPGGGAFTGANSKTSFVTKVVSCLDLSNITFYLDNQTNQAATLYAMSAIDQNAAKTGQFANVAVAAGSLLPVGVNLETTVIPYMQGNAVFGTAPTSGYLRLMALARRAI